MVKSMVNKMNHVHNFFGKLWLFFQASAFFLTDLFICSTSLAMPNPTTLKKGVLGNSVQKKFKLECNQ